MRAVVLLFIVAMGLPVFADEPAAYAKPELLIEVDALRASLKDRPRVLKPRRIGEEWGQGEITLLDVRTRQQYQAGTLADARHVDAAQWAVAFGDGTDVEGWSERIGAVLLNGPQSTVVVFDSHVTPTAARIWWILKYWGVEDVRILNGGFAAWRRAGGKVTAPDKILFEGVFKAEPQRDRLRTTEQMVQLARSGTTRIIDARSPREFITTGAIGPLVQQCEWIELIDQQTGKFKPADQLAKALRLTHYDVPFRSPPVVTYCRSGGRSSVTALALELMGVEQVANYYGSWNEWEKRGATLDTESSQ